MKQGILYIATGNQYLEEAIQSAESIAKNTTGYSTTLLTNQDVSVDIFNNVQTIEQNDPFGDKIRLLQQTPYNKTVFLDTDTFICDSFDELFELLEHYDLAAAHAPGRKAVSLTGVPESFPEYNTGVLSYNSSNSIYNFFDNWLNEYERERGTKMHDQPAFRRALYKANLRFATIPPEYNCRTVWPGYVDGSVSIIHGRHNNHDKVRSKLNRSTSMRVFLPYSNSIKVYTNPKSSIMRQVIRKSRVDEAFKIIADLIR